MLDPLRYTNTLKQLKQFPIPYLSTYNRLVNQHSLRHREFHASLVGDNRQRHASCD
uniref:Uncharacterized protein n=1 Tax=Oryza brachyantha TaxID=4533 RepID=J3M971_ORYBR